MSDVTVNVDLRDPAQNGTDVPANGRLECRPTLRRNVGTHITLPAPFNVRLVNGQATLVLAETTTAWCWKIVERPNRGTTRYVAVTGPGPVNYGDLVDVDPATLDPAAPIPPIWKTYVDAADNLRELKTDLDGDSADLVGTPASELAVAVAAKIAAAAALRAPDYVSGRAYIVGELVTYSGTLYRITTAYTSSGGSLDLSKATAIGGGGGGAVSSVNAKTGAVVLNPDDLDDALTAHKFVTAAEKTKLGNTSGTNTGDQDLSALAPLASPALTGNPTTPTPSPGDNDTSIANTAFVQAAIAAGGGSDYTRLNAKYIDTLNGLIGATTVGFVTGQSTVQTSVTSAVSSGATVLPVASATGILPTMSLILNYGTASQQVVKVVSVASNNVTVSPALTAGVANAGKVSPLWNDQFHLTGWGYTGIAYYVVNAKNADGSDVFSLSSGQRITFFGNSWIAGKSQWADAVTVKFPTAVTTNAGVGGDTSADLLARFATDVPTDSKYVVFNEPGGNDIGLGTSKTTVVDNLQKLVRKIQAIGAIPIYTGTAPLAGFLTDSLSDATMVNDLMRDGHMAAADGILGLVAKPLSSWFTVTGTGDVVGPSSAVDNAIARFDTTTGKLIQTSPVTISDAGKVSGIIAGTTGGDAVEYAQMNTALSGKEPTITAGSTAQYLRGDKSLATLNADVVPDGTTNKAYTATEKTKLAGVAAGATANSSDATLEARANHTGTQLASTISDFSTAADARITAGNAAVATLTNKRITKRVVSVTSSATVTIDLDATDVEVITAQAVALTLATTGTPTDGQSIVIRIKDNGTARAINYPASFRAIGVTLPTTTVISKTLYLGGAWNAADSKIDIIAVAQEA